MTNDVPLRIIRIFVSSPADVADERDRAKQVIEGLRRRYSHKFLLKAVLWEELALQANMSFQQGIDRVGRQPLGHFSSQEKLLSLK